MQITVTGIRRDLGKYHTQAVEITHCRRKVRCSLAALTGHVSCILISECSFHSAPKSPLQPIGEY